MTNLGLKNILADCLARVLSEKKARLPTGQVELNYMQSFFAEAKLTPEERERALNYRLSWRERDPNSPSFGQLAGYAELAGEGRFVLSVEAMTVIAKANPIAKLLFQPRWNDERSLKRNTSFYVDALMPYYVGHYLKQYTGPELLKAYLASRRINPNMVYKYDPETDLVEKRNKRTGVVIRQLTLNDLAYSLAINHLNEVFSKGDKAAAASIICKEVGGPEAEQKLLVEYVISLPATNRDQRRFLNGLGFGDNFSPGYTRPYIPPTIPHADFVKFFQHSNQIGLQNIITLFGFQEKFYTYVFSRFTLDQLKDYRQALIAQGVDVSECSDAYVAKMNRDFRNLLLSKELGTEALAPEVFGFL